MGVVVSSSHSSCPPSSSGQALTNCWVWAPSPGCILQEQSAPVWLPTAARREGTELLPMDLPGLHRDNPPWAVLTAAFPWGIVLTQQHRQHQTSTWLWLCRLRQCLFSHQECCGASKHYLQRSSNGWINAQLITPNCWDITVPACTAEAKLIRFFKLNSLKNKELFSCYP